MSFQDAAEAIISNESERTAASPRFPPRNHDDLVQAREYEEMLDNYSFSKVCSLLNKYGILICLLIV